MLYFKYWRNFVWCDTFNPLPDDKILDWSKLKQVADNILKCISKEKLMSYRIENIVRKVEIACFKQFSFAHNVFHSYKSLVRQNAAMCCNELMHSAPLFTGMSHDLFYINQKRPLPQICHVTSSFPL